MISRFINKNKYQKELINNLENIYNDIQVKYKHLSIGDFPDVDKMKVQDNAL